MTASEPVAMTLEEAMVALGKAGKMLHWRPDADGLAELGCHPSTFADEWPEAVSNALGYPVVARDEAAELRAAIHEYFGWLDEKRITRNPDQLLTAENELVRAEAALRRIVGMEG